MKSRYSVTYICLEQCFSTSGPHCNFRVGHRARLKYVRMQLSRHAITTACEHMTLWSLQHSANEDVGIRSDFSSNIHHNKRSWFNNKFLIELRIDQRFPTGGSRKNGCVVANSSLNVIWSLECLELRASTFCYISKTETRTDICEVHIISIVTPIDFSYTVWVDLDLIVE